MLDNNMIKYRKKHPKCDWCKYYQFNSKCFGEINWDECILKDKIIEHPHIKARLCKYYTLKEENKDEIQTDKRNEPGVQCSTTNINK